MRRFAIASLVACACAPGTAPAPAPSPARPLASASSSAPLAPLAPRVDVSLVADQASSGGPDARTIFVVSNALSFRAPILEYRAPFECSASKDDRAMFIRCSDDNTATVTFVEGKLVLRRVSDPPTEFSLPADAFVTVDTAIVEAPAIARPACAPGAAGPTFDVLFSARRDKPLDPSMPKTDLLGELRTAQAPWTVTLFKNMPPMLCNAAGNDGGSKMAITCSSTDAGVSFEAYVDAGALVITRHALEFGVKTGKPSELARVRLPCGAKIRAHATAYRDPRWAPFGAP